MNTRRIKVSKAALLAATVTVGLLAPGPAVLPADWLVRSTAQPVSLLQVARASQAECAVPRRELRFEMLAAGTEVAPYAAGPDWCMAVYRPFTSDPWENAARH